MAFPKFLLGDNTAYPEAIFVIHTQFPRFIINLADDEVEWMEEFDKSEQKDLENEALGLFKQANDFYDNEISHYQD